METVLLVEGLSDRAALEVLAARQGRDLAAEGVRIVPTDGVTNFGRFLLKYGPLGLDLRLAGLYDAGQEEHLRRALVRAALCPDPGLESVGFFACVADLEDELIRALGAAQLERLIAAAGELASFRLLQMQPAQRGRSVNDQLRRFISGRSGNKHRFAALMAGALDLGRVPRPLGCLLDHVAR